MDPRKQRWAAAILVGLCVIVWARGLSMKPARSKRSETPAVSAPAAAPPVSSPRSSEWGDNPFLIERRVSSAMGGPEGLVLSGILWDSKIPSAVVNSRLVTVGEYLGQWQVIEIQKRAVVLSDGKTTKVLTVE